MSLEDYGLIYVLASRYDYHGDYLIEKIFLSK